MGLPEKITIKKDNAGYADGRLKRMYLHEYILLDTEVKDSAEKADTTQPVTVMVVTKVIGGWIYELQSSNKGDREWQPVFVPDQYHVAEILRGMILDAMSDVINNQPAGYIPVRQV